MKTLIFLALGTSIAFAEVFTTTDKFTVKVGATSRVVTCNTVKITYTGTVINKAQSQVKCTANWPKTKQLNKVQNLNYQLGNPTDGIFTATLTIKLFKQKNKPPNKMTTTLQSVASTILDGDPEFYPATLWCPQENYFIWGEGDYSNIVDEAPADDYAMCAQRCAELKDDAGNAPCFSWTFNSNSKKTLGLAAGYCRLLGYMNVAGIASDGMQSGYHKCWNAMLTSVGP